MNMETSAAPTGSRATALTTVVAPISWGTTYVVVTELLPAGRPLLVAAVRVVPAGLVLLAIGARRAGWRPVGRAWGRTAVLGICNFGLFFPLLFAAVYRLPGGVAAAGGGLQPLLVAILTWALSGRRPAPRDLAIGVVAAVGVGLVVLRPGAGFDPVGLLAVLGANLSFSFGIVLTKRWAAPANRLASTGWQLLIGGALIVPLALVLEGGPPAVGPSAVAGFAYLSLVGTALAYLLWFNGIRRLRAAAPPLLGLAAPVTGAAMGWIVLGEALSGVQLLGFAVTLGAIAHGATTAADRPSTGAEPIGLPGPAAPPAAVPAGREREAVAAAC